MPSITLTDPVTGTTVASGLIATNNSNLRTLLNAGIDGANLKGNPALVSGDVPVWNGTQFNRPTGTGSATTFLRGDGSWATAGLKTTVGTIAAGPPGSPATNDIWIATDVDAVGTVWQFRYNSAETTYKWEFIGGPPTIATVNAFEAANFNSTWGNLTTVGPTVTVARGGDYFITATANASGGGGADTLMVGVANGNATPVVPLLCETSQASAGLWLPFSCSGAMTGLSAGATPRMRYNGGNQSNSFQARTITVTPIRVI